MAGGRDRASRRQPASARRSKPAARTHRPDDRIGTVMAARWIRCQFQRGPRQHDGGGLPLAALADARRHSGGGVGPELGAGGLAVAALKAGVMPKALNRGL